MNTLRIGRMPTIVMLSFLSASITAHAGITTRVSVDSEGREGGEGGGATTAISTDGRYVAFESGASTLVPFDTNNAYDVFVRDRQTGATTRVSVDSAGGQGTTNTNSSTPALSADGRYVAFVSDASNLVPNDTNDTLDIFVHDRQTGSTTRVSVDSNGGQGNGHSYLPALNADGRYVAFASWASNLVPGDTNDLGDVFVHDRQTGSTTRVSVDNAGGQSNSESFSASLSADGRYVAFGSWASNLVPNDTNDTWDIFVHDRQTGRTTRVSVDSAGEQGNGEFGSTASPALSADGRYVAFVSDASNLVPNDTNDRGDIFVHDRQTGSTTRVSVDSTGGQGNEESYSSSLSADGRYVAFSSSASNLVPGDTNAAYDIFVHDRLGVLLEGPTGAPSCSDGLDNDSDGNIDASDVDCAPVPPPLMCNGRRATIVGTAGNDTIKGTVYDDVITGRAGDDVINGAGGNDVVCGGNGNDTLNGGPGRNILRGGNGNDTVNGGDSRDRLYGGPGDDALNGGNGVDKLHGGTGNDICDGQGGTDAHLGGCETVVGIP